MDLTSFQVERGDKSYHLNLLCISLSFHYMILNHSNLYTYLYLPVITIHLLEYDLGMHGKVHWIFLLVGTRLYL